MTAATTLEEIPFWVESEGYSLFGIITKPTVEANGHAVVLATGGSRAPSFGRNRVWVDAARRFAALGFHTVRFSFRTTGESTGGSAEYLLGDPWDQDVLAVTRRVLAEDGVDKVVFGGICFGSRSQLKAAEAVPELAGFAAIPVPSRDFGQAESSASYPISWYVKRLAKPATWPQLWAQRAGVWRVVKKRVNRIRRRFGKAKTGGSAVKSAGAGVSSDFVRYLRGINQRQIPVLLAFGSRDKFWEDFQAAQKRHPDLVEPSSVELDIADDFYLHGMRTIETQQWIIDRFERFLTERVVNQ